MKIACMQPYFLPYAGYFRLLCGVDAFVIVDAVQFPARGWVHRNRLRRIDGALAWLTLPLDRAPHVTAVNKRKFHPQAEKLWPSRLRRFDACVSPSDQARPIVARLNGMEGSLTTYLAGLLQETLVALGMDVPPIFMESELDLDPHPGCSNRVINLCRHFGATEYVNAPGGRALYDPAVFAAHGVRLAFLPPYRGDNASILQRLHDSPAAIVRGEIERNLHA